MKKILFVLLSLSAVGFIMFNMASAKPNNDLFEIASILERENIMINEWSLYAREKLETAHTDQELAQQRNHWMKQFPHLDWKISEDKEKWEAVAVLNKEKDVRETIQILSAETETYIIYKVNGTGWGEKTQKFIQNSVLERINDIFHGNTTTFSCITGDLGGKMNEALPDNVKSLLTAFHAQEIESLKEDAFISTSAYSPLFAETINGRAGAMNLQFGIRQGLGGKTTLVVGTPIITIEY